MQEFERAGIAVVPGYMAPRWLAEAETILATVDLYHRHAARYQDIGAFRSVDMAASLSDDLRSVAPSFGAFVDYLRACLQAAGCGAYVAELGIGDFVPDRRARLLYALAACLGEPSPTDAKHGQIVWDIAP